MKLKNVVQAALLGGTVLLSATAFAATGTTTSSAIAASTPVAAPANPTDSANEAFLSRLAAQLNLTTDQQTKVRAIMAAARPEFKGYMDQLAKTQQGLYDAVNGATYDKNQVKKLAQQQGNLVAKIIIARADMHHQLMAVLTPQQRQTLSDLLQKQTTQLQTQTGAPEQPAAQASAAASTAAPATATSATPAPAASN